MRTDVVSAAILRWPVSTLLDHESFSHLTQIALVSEDARVFDHIRDQMAIIEVWLAKLVQCSGLEGCMC